MDDIETTYVDLGLETDTNIENIKSVSVWWCLFIWIKQHLSNIWSSIHENVKQKKKRCLYKKRVSFDTCVKMRRKTSGLLIKTCSEKICSKVPMLKCNFSKVALQLYWNYILAWTFHSHIRQVIRIWRVRPAFLYFLPLLLAFCLNLTQSSAFSLMETKLSRQIILQKRKRKIDHRSIKVDQVSYVWVMIV